MEFVKWIEAIGVLLNFTFLYLLIKEQKSCWIYGFLGSIASGYAVFQNQFYSEALLYLFYAIVAIYGFFTWSRLGERLRIKILQPIFIVIWICVGICGTVLLGRLMETYTDAFQPYFDALSSIFGIIATFLEMYKYKIAWVFWLCLNLYSIWLYGLKNLDFLSFQMVVYTVFSGYGYWKWTNKFKTQ